METVTPHSKECEICRHLKSRSDENTLKVLKTKEKISKLKTHKFNFDHYNTSKDPDYVEACQRAETNKLLKKEKDEKLKLLDIKWQKYNKCEQFILQIIEIIYSIAFLRGFIHPVILENSWMFCLFRKK